MFIAKLNYIIKLIYYDYVQLKCTKFANTIILIEMLPQDMLFWNTHLPAPKTNILMNFKEGILIFEENSNNSQQFDHRVK